MLSELKKKFIGREKKFFSNPGAFLSFCIGVIFISLFLHSRGYSDLVFFLLAFLWFIFWANSTPLGKSFLIVASLVGFTHELIGTYFGWFSYTTDLWFRVPYYILPGYGCIYWAIQNFWLTVSKKHLMPPRVFHSTVLLTIAAMYAIDFFFLSFSPTILSSTLLIILLLALFTRTSLAEQHLTYFVFLITGFNEAMGVLLGAWAHYPFSLVSAVPPYAYLVWLCVALTHKLLGDREITRTELLIGILVFFLYGFRLIRLM